MQFSPDQKRAGFWEFAVGVPFNIAFFCGLYYWWLPDYPGLDTELNRLIFAIKCAALPAATLMTAVGMVALGRATSPALDPLQGLESKTLQILIRFLQNTLEQSVIFVCSSLALSLYLGPQTIKIIPAAAILFVVNRILFLAGYLKDPALRGMGLSGTLYPNMLMTAAALFYGLCDIFGL